ncbi:hypothetical protein HPB50_012430 [Hyalomma asiaticum]|uniref:Uncharacterized protein n=1 Tax=Hyalomma asiaticum TaxID=266040 RepID=A0ACB7SXQ0_HYAAI|nr:hypothetical protein HPB50_012430 [Hyalomma asiaticum]
MFTVLERSFDSKQSQKSKLNFLEASYANSDYFGQADFTPKVVATKVKSLLQSQKTSPAHRKQKFKALFHKANCIPSLSNRLVVCGDFNAPNQAWGYGRTLVKGRDLLQDTTNLGLTLITGPADPTRIGNSVTRDTTPDLKFVRSGGGVNADTGDFGWRNTGHELGSNHYIVEIAVPYDALLLLDCYLSTFPASIVQTDAIFWTRSIIHLLAPDEGALKCLLVCMKEFARFMGSVQDALEKTLLRLLVTWNSQLVQELVCECVALLPCCRRLGSSSNKVMSSSEAWSHQLGRLMATVHTALDSLFQDLHVGLACTSHCWFRIKMYLSLCTESSVLTFQSSSGATAQANIVAAILPSIQHEAVQLLSQLICSCRQLLIPEAANIVGLIEEVCLRTTQDLSNDTRYALAGTMCLILRMG